MHTGALVTSSAPRQQYKCTSRKSTAQCAPRGSPLRVTGAAALSLSEAVASPSHKRALLREQSLQLGARRRREYKHNARRSEQTY